MILRSLLLVATQYPPVCRLLKITSLFCKRALSKRLYSAKETYTLKEPTSCSHPIALVASFQVRFLTHDLIWTHLPNCIRLFLQSNRDWFWFPIFRPNWYVRDVHKQFVLSPGTVKSMTKRSHSRLKFIWQQFWYKLLPYEFVNPTIKMSLLD